MSFGLLQTALFLPVETLLNKLLQLDGASVARLAAMDGQTLAVYVTRPEFTFFVSVRGQQLHFSSVFEAAPTASIHGSSRALLNLLLQQQAIHNLAPHAVELRGSTAFVQQLQTLLQDLDVDWEFQLSRIIGDLPTAAISKTVETGRDFVQSSATAMKHNVHDYLSHESRMFVSKATQELFQENLRELHLRCDRLEARINHAVNNL